MKLPHAIVTGWGLLLVSVTGQAAAAWVLTTLDYPTALKTTPTGISGGSIVGTYQFTSGIFAPTYGFLFDGTTCSNFTPPNGPPGNTHLTGISGGNIVGYCGNQVGAFLYDGNTYTSLNSLPGRPLAIDGSNIVGSYYDFDDQGQPYGYPHGFVYDSSSVTTLDAPGAQSTQLSGISGNNIVGQYTLPTSVTRGFLYDGVNWTTLQFQYNGKTAYVLPNGIDGTRMVGACWALIRPGVEVYSGAYYDGNTWSLLDYPGIGNLIPTAISGDNIVGYYTDTGGVQHGFLLTVPEPATLCLLALGGLTIMQRRSSWQAAGTSQSRAASILR